MLLLFLWDDNYKKTSQAETKINSISINPQKPAQKEDKEKSKEELGVFATISQNLKHPIAVLLIQIIVVLIVARAFTILFRKIGQPSVIGEIVAGIVLGPSVLGLFFPDLGSNLFPRESLKYLQLLSQVGLIFFMFIIGMELDTSTLKQKAQSAAFISHMSIVFPFMCGSILAYYLFDYFAPKGIKFLSFGLFMGIAMSITAFPVLARIIQEKNLTKTPIGIIAITCAAVDDISAWTILAFIIAVAQAKSMVSSFVTIIITAVFVGIMVFIIQPFLTRLSKVYITQEIIGRGVMSMVVIILLTSSLITESLGIHALFGAFLAGVIMPTQTNLRKTITEKFEDFSSVVLLPLFFAFTGLRTQINLISNSSLILVTILIIFTATLGKFGASFLSARFIGMSYRESSIIGLLMNTRGLMELIVLNIGYDLGILSPEIFAMMVLMALFTTFITGPIVGFLLPKQKESEHTSMNTRLPRALIAFGPPKAGVSLFNLAYGIYGKKAIYTALHISPIPEKISIETNIQEDNFEQIKVLAEENGAKLNTIHQVTSNVTNELVSSIQKESYSIVLMGAAQQIFGDNAIGGKVETILSGVQTKVGIFIDRGLAEIKSVLIYYENQEESDALFEIGSAMQSSGVKDMTLVYEKENEPPKEKIREFFSKPIKIVPTSKHSKKVMLEYSLIIFGYKHWVDYSSGGGFIDKAELQKENNSSILILRMETQN
ncbi:MAG: cation:proton antiporter [Leptospiraceae bacterium]|nr:cation:proton antiporter [Leptospiraceae bacterium]